MRYREAKPSTHLARFIKCFWSIESDAAADAAPETVLPDGCPEIVFNLADRFQRLHIDGRVETQPSAIVSGQLKRNILIRPTGRISLFGVRFHPSGAWPFLRSPMNELTDRIESYDSLPGLPARLTEEKISEANTFEERVSLFEAEFHESLSSIGDIDPIAESSAAMIVKCGGKIPVRQLLDVFCISERRLERKFERSVGMSPKMFSRIVRFQNVVRYVEQSAEAAMIDAALSFGYYDQSHMIREFNEFSGKSPLSYFEETHRISQLFTSSA
ncbi:MAG: AraC family transcriptional regulator [Blastocatellia bacterium]